MAKPLTLPPLSDTQVTELRQLYDTTPHAKLRLRAHIVLLAHQGRSVAEIAAMVLRSHDTVERVRKRFLQGGIAALPPRTAPGRAPTVTPEWHTALLRVIDLDPHPVGVHLAPQTHSRSAAGLRGKRLRVEVILAGASTPTPPPVTALVDADLLEDVPPDVDELLRLLPHADVYLQEEVQVAFHPTLTRVWCRKGRRGQRLVEAPGAHDKVYGFGLVDWCEGWFDGRLAPGRTADVFCAQLRAAVERSRVRGRRAFIIADNLRTHTPAGAKLVRQMLTEWQDHLRIIYPPAYDPDANRIEWLWRGSRREVTHHQRTTFATLLEDIHKHFEPLRQHPDLVLRQIGSPFADQVSATQPLPCAA